MQSVLSQNFDDFEYIVIDGGSGDGTCNVIEKYSDRLAYWHSKPDRGLAHAFNQGIEHSKGKWLIFLNSDDFFVDASVLGKFATELGTRPDFDVVYGQIDIVSRETIPQYKGGPYGKPFKWWRFVVVNDVLPHPAAATNRALFERIGVFREDMSIALDHEFFLRAGPDMKIKFVPFLVASMRDGGMSKVNPGESFNHNHQARLAANVLSPRLSRLLYYYQVTRSMIGRLVRRQA